MPDDKESTYFIFTATSFPREGWLQTCYVCMREITSRTLPFAVPEKEKWRMGKRKKVAVFVCNECEKGITESRAEKERYEARVRAYIRDYI